MIIGGANVKEFIDNKMDEIFNDFQEYLNDEDRYCRLKDFRFNNGHTPEYSNELIQQYYLLKYLPAYFTEYCCIYDDIINSNFLDEDYNILSIGCGCGIDLWGAKFATEDSDIDIRYTGLDIVDWRYWDSVGIEEVYYLNNDINELEELDEEEYNIIMFPKSIGELDGDTFKKLKDAISNSNFSKDKLIIASSIRNTRAWYDEKRTNEVISIFENKHGYSNLDSDTGYIQFEKKSNGYDYRISDILEDIEYPEEIKTWLTNFYMECQGYKENDDTFCEKACSDVFTRKPVTTVSQVAYKIIRLERTR